MTLGRQDVCGPVPLATAFAGNRGFQKHFVRCDQVCVPFHLMRKWIIRRANLAANDCPSAIAHQPEFQGVAIFSGTADITLNRADITAFFTVAPRACQRFFYRVFHHRQSRRLCEVAPHCLVARIYCRVRRAAEEAGNPREIVRDNIIIRFFSDIARSRPWCGRR